MNEEVAGWITFKTKIDDKYFKDGIKKTESELKRLEKENEKLQERQKQVDIKFNIDKEDLRKKYEEAVQGLAKDRKDTLSWINAGAGSGVGVNARYQERLNQLNTDYESNLQKISQKHDEINEKLKNNNIKYEDTKKNLEDIVKKYDEWKEKQGGSSEDENEESPTSPKGITKASRNLDGLIRKVTRWGLAIFGIRGAYSMIRQAMSSISQENKQVGADIEYMRWAISKSLEPVVIRIVGWLMKLMQSINYVVYKLTGFKIFGEATANAFKKANGSAKQLQKTMAGFDEMNIVGSSSTGGGGGMALPSEDLNDFGQLSDGLKEKLDKVVDALRPFWEIVKKVGDWIKDHPQGFAMILGGLLSASVLTKIGALIGAGGTATVAGTGLYGILAVLLLIAEVQLGEIIKEAGELHEELKGQNDVLSQSSNNWEDLRNSMLKAALQDRNNVEANKKLQDSILNNIKANDTLTDGIKNQSWFAQYLIGDFTRMTDAERILVDERNRDIQSLEIMNKAGILQKEGKEYLIKLYGEEIEALEKQTKNTWLSTEERKKYNEKLNETREKLKAVTDPDWTVKVKEDGTDETKQKVEEVGDLLKDSIDKTFEAKISADTTPANKKMTNWLNRIGNTLFSVFFPNLNFISTLAKFRYAKGGIINLPGKGVPIGGEAGREGVVPLTDEQQMQLLGESIGKYVTINLTNVTKLDSREINRKNEKVRSENTFLRNR